MMKWLWCLTVIAPLVHASTFVGNGGGAGDVELAVTKKQTQESFAAIKRRTGDSINLCRCNMVYESRSVCEPLQNLNIEQKQFCTKTLFAQTPEILRLLSDPKAVSFRWTNEQILVADRGKPRAVDAVTDRAKSEITINLERFLKMQSFERVYLLSHELFHLTSLDGKPMEDEGAIGPFEGDQGGRLLLNAMGSTAAVLEGEFPDEIKTYRDLLNRSQSWKRHWFSLSSGHAGSGDGRAAGTFSATRFSRTGLDYRYNLGNWMLTGSYRTEFNRKKVLGVVAVKEEVYIYSLGAGYRIFPFKDPASYWGQTYFLVEGLLDYVNPHITLSDPVTEAKDKASAFGGTVSLNYFIPVSWGLWLHAGAALEHHPYKYKDVNLKYKKSLISTYIGVSYAF